MGVSKGGRSGWGIWHSLCLCSLLISFQVSIINTDRVDCAFLDAHNRLASASNTWPFTFCEASFLLEGVIRSQQET